MTPLFKLPVTGGALVGHEKNESFEMPNTLEAPATYNPIKLSVGDEIGNFKVIGPLSDVTEEMAREWGFNELYGISAKETFEDAIAIKLHALGNNTDISNILLILIKVE